MNVRHILVAASAAAILAGSSFGALAGSHNFSKGESKSSVNTAAFFIYTPVAINKQKEHTTSIVKGDGEAAAGATTSGGALALQGYFSIGSGGGAPIGTASLNSPSGGYGISGEGQVAAAWGSTSGSSCAGSGCNSNGNVGNQ